VNQAAERIVFADNGDGSVTAVIQILYEGPSENFSWLLPISTVPEGDDIAVASDLAFARLQAVTNPIYTLTTQFEGECKGDPRGPCTNCVAAIDPTTDDAESGGGGVTVAASGIVGSFEWTVISLDQSLADPAGAAVDWLGENGFDVPPGAPALLGPYLEEGLHLLALKLTKGADAGSIRPIVLTYAASRPAIPIKLTQVAANDDMGVLTWVLGAAQAVPKNYLSLELNEARINWFNPTSNYNDVVIEAANETGTGQGFVTEYSAPAARLATTVFGLNDEQTWLRFRSNSYATLADMFLQAFYGWGSWDGFWDAARASASLPEGTEWEDVQDCPSCYAEALTYNPSDFVAALEANVLEPVRLVQRLIDAHPHVTRLYTTLSAAEMTLDPIFTFNPDLADVSNVHTATRYVECSSEYTSSEAPWRIELPQGGTVHGPGSPIGSPSWPSPLSDQPANRRIVQAGESGPGRVLEDNSGVIEGMLSDLNATTSDGTRVRASGGGGCSLGSRHRPGQGGAGWLGFSALFALFVLRQIWPSRR
jgi:hypothetical protein